MEKSANVCYTYAKERRWPKILLWVALSPILAVMSLGGLFPVLAFVMGIGIVIYDLLF